MLGLHVGTIMWCWDWMECFVHARQAHYQPGYMVEGVWLGLVMGSSFFM